jgi:hypothetical protein
MILRAHSVQALALAAMGLFAAHNVLADEAPTAAPVVSLSCDAEHADEARASADLAMKQGAYERAGQCYLAAGDYDSANRAFLKSARPAAVETGRAVVQQRDAARALLSQVKGAFRSNR